MGGYFDRRNDRGVVCVFSILSRMGVYVCVCVYICTHTHTHCTDGVLGCEPRGRDETPGGPEESRWTKSRHICIRICVQSTHMYIYARRRDEILVMMMTAFITIKSSLVPLIEGPCARIYFRFAISVVYSHLLLFFFEEEKIF